MEWLCDLKHLAVRYRSNSSVIGLLRLFQIIERAETVLKLEKGESGAKNGSW